VSRAAPAKLFPFSSFVTFFVTFGRRSPGRVGLKETDKKESDR
jgi:hypothetical protein